MAGTINITYCWTEPSGYLSACVRALAQRPGMRVTLVHTNPPSIAPFDLHNDAAVNTVVLRGDAWNDFQTVRKAVVASKPDVVVFAGWQHRPYVQLLGSPELAGARFVMAVDTPARFDWRQRLARLKIGRLLRRVDAILVPGEWGYQLMRYWGVPGEKVTRQLYCVDHAACALAVEPRLASGVWPRRFLFVGRYVPAKGVDVLVEAYSRYRQGVSDPWSLVTCGTGPMQPLLVADGIDDRGFVQPGDLPSVFREAGAFILPSRSDAWGQAIVEAAAAGLPVVCTQGCGASETVKDFHNGFVVPVGDAKGIARALRWLHEHHGLLPEMGRRATEGAAAYSAERWADVQVTLCERLVRGD